MTFDVEIWTDLAIYEDRSIFLHRTTPGAFDNLRQESTVLVIAHKLNTVTAADQIVVLNGRGQVAQVGTHEELVGVDGFYREFWQNRELASGWKIMR